MPRSLTVNVTATIEQKQTGSSILRQTLEQSGAAKVILLWKDFIVHQDYKLGNCQDVAEAERAIKAKLAHYLREVKIELKSEKLSFQKISIKAENGKSIAEIKVRVGYDDRHVFYMHNLRASSIVEAQNLGLASITEFLSALEAYLAQQPIS